MATDAVCRAVPELTQAQVRAWARRVKELATEAGISPRAAAWELGQRNGNLERILRAIDEEDS